MSANPRSSPRMTTMFGRRGASAAHAARGAASAAARLAASSAFHTSVLRPDLLALARVARSSSASIVDSVVCRFMGIPSTRLAPRPFGVLGGFKRSALDDRLDPGLADRAHEGPVVGAVLIRVLDREFADRVVEGLPRTHVAGDHRGASDAGMRARQRVGTHARVLPQCRALPVFDDGGHLHIAQLANVHVATVLAARPSDRSGSGSVPRRGPRWTGSAVR